MESTVLQDILDVIIAAVQLKWRQQHNNFQSYYHLNCYIWPVLVRKSLTETIKVETGMTSVLCWLSGNSLFCILFSVWADSNENKLAELMRRRHVKKLMLAAPRQAAFWSQTLSLRSKLISLLSDAHLKIIRIFCQLRSQPLLIKTHEETMENFQHLSVACSSVALIMDDLSNLGCLWVGFLKSRRKTSFITVLMWQPACNGKDLGIYCEILFVQSVLLKKMFVFVLSFMSTDFEIQRQIDILQRGGAVLKETRAYDSKSG